MLRAAGEALVHLALPEDLEHSIPKTLVSTGALLGVAWLVVQQEPQEAYKSLVAAALKVCSALPSGQQAALHHTSTVLPHVQVWCFACHLGPSIHSKAIVMHLAG